MTLFGNVQVKACRKRLTLENVNIGGCYYKKLIILKIQNIGFMNINNSIL